MDEQTNLRIIALQHAINRQGPSTEYEIVRIAEVYLAFLEGSETASHPKSTYTEAMNALNAANLALAKQAVR